MLPTALLLTFLAAGQVASSDTALNINIDLELTAVTTSGTYTGFVDDAAPNVKQWLGIRYGKAPVGRKRFMPPEPSVDMTTHYYAREYKPICFQQSGNHTGLFWELVPEFQNQDPQSEDCLYLNVWAPKKPAKKVPVLIWVCGGGLQEGGGHALYQIPDQWLEKTESHVVVTFKSAQPCEVSVCRLTNGQLPSQCVWISRRSGCARKCGLPRRKNGVCSL